MKLSHFIIGVVLCWLAIGGLVALACVASGCQALPVRTDVRAENIEAVETAVVQVKEIAVRLQAAAIRFEKTTTQTAGDGSDINDPEFLATWIRWSVVGAIVVAVAIVAGAVLIVLVVRRYGYTARNWQKKRIDAACRRIPPNPSPRASNVR